MSQVTQRARILIGDRSELMQRWIGMAATRGAAGRSAEVTYAGCGAELLYRLAEDGPFDLVVTQATLPYIAGAQVLAMVRSAGLSTPFVVLDYVPSRMLRELVARVGDATLVDDPLDSNAVCGAASAYLRPEGKYGAHAFGLRPGSGAPANVSVV